MTLYTIKSAIKYVVEKLIKNEISGLVEEDFETIGQKATFEDLTDNVEQAISDFGIFTMPPDVEFDNALVVKQDDGVYRVRMRLWQDNQESDYDLTMLIKENDGEPRFNIRGIIMS